MQRATAQHGQEKELRYLCRLCSLNRNKLTIDYDPHSVWALIQDDFTAHLPLRNLHWKSANRPLRSIQSLDVEMRHYDPAADEQPHQMPISLLERPYLNMMLVKCDVRTNQIGRPLTPPGQRNLSKLSPPDYQNMVQRRRRQAKSRMAHPARHPKNIKCGRQSGISILHEGISLRQNTSRLQ